MICDHTPDGELRAHIEIWKTDNDQWAVIGFARPELDPQVIAQPREVNGCTELGPLLEIAAETLTDAVVEMDLDLEEA